MRVVAVCAVLLLATSARADDTLEAKKQQAAEYARDAFARIKDARDFAGASDLFGRAYDLTQDLTYLLNKAVAQRKALLPHQSVQSYLRYLELGGDTVAADAREAITADIALMRRQSAHVVVRTAGAPAQITLDDYDVGVASRETPLEVLVSTDGGKKHRVKAARAEYNPTERELDPLQPGQLVELSLEPVLPPKTGKLTLTTDPPGATLTNGKRGELLGISPTRVELAPGDYEIWARLDGRKPQPQQVHLRAGDTQAVTFHLEPIPTWWQSNRKLVLIGGGVAAVVAGVLLVPVINNAVQPDYDVRITYP